MIVYTATFARHDGTEFAQIGTFSDIQSALAAAEDYALWRSEVAAAHDGAPIAPAALSWRHHGPAPRKDRYHELWLGRDGWLNFYVVHRTELGQRAWRQESLAARLQNGSLIPPSWALPDVSESSKAAVE